MYVVYQEMYGVCVYWVGYAQAESMECDKCDLTCVCVLEECQKCARVYTIINGTTADSSTHCCAANSFSRGVV